MSIYARVPSPLADYELDLLIARRPSPEFPDTHVGDVERVRLATEPVRPAMPKNDGEAGLGGEARIERDDATDGALQGKAEVRESTCSRLTLETLIIHETREHSESAGPGEPESSFMKLANMTVTDTPTDTSPEVLAPGRTCCNMWRRRITAAGYCSTYRLYCMRKSCVHCRPLMGEKHFAPTVAAYEAGTPMWVALVDSGAWFRLYNRLRMAANRSGNPVPNYTRIVHDGMSTVVMDVEFEGSTLVSDLADILTSAFSWNVNAPGRNTISHSKGWRQAQRKPRADATAEQPRTVVVTGSKADREAHRARYGGRVLAAAEQVEAMGSDVTFEVTARNAAVRRAADARPDVELFDVWAAEFAYEDADLR